MIIAIDPGTIQSALIIWDSAARKVEHADMMLNPMLARWLKDKQVEERLYIEMIASYGMPVGKEIFETCVWIGRFIGAWRFSEPVRVYRRDIKMHHCGSARAKDSNIRQALIDKYGEPGTKKAPGVTYGLKKDLWAAFALATYASETAGQPLSETGTP